MLTRDDRPRWPGRMKWLIASAVFGAVVAAGCHDQCRQTVALCALEGIAFGMLFGLVALGSRAAEVRRPGVVLTPSRMWLVVRKEAHAATAVGLIGGLVKAVVLVIGG